MKLFSLLLVAVSFAGVSCERHEFEETRKLQDHHAPAGGHDEHAEHGDSHGEAHPEKSEH